MYLGRQVKTFSYLHFRTLLWGCAVVCFKMADHLFTYKENHFCFFNQLIVHVPSLPYRKVGSIGIEAIFSKSDENSRHTYLKVSINTKQNPCETALEHTDKMKLLKWSNKKPNSKISTGKRRITKRNKYK